MAWTKVFLFVALLHAVTATASFAQSDQEVYAEVERIGDDGKFHEDEKTSGKVNASGNIVELSDEVAEIKLSNAHRIQVMPAGNDRLALLVWDPAGKPALLGIVLERVK